MSDIIKFLSDNNLNEVITDKPCDYFLIKDQKKIINISKQKNPSPPVKIIQDQPIRTQSHLQIKTVSSTFEAIQLLVKKSQENMNNQNQPVSPAISLSINDIVKKAKDLADNAANLEELKKAVENFDGCNLKKMATNTVFSDGNSNSKIMLIGEAPGNNEDLQGIPFCGDSGKLLNEMFKAINLTRDNFYITNTIFWRPPGNRKPTPEELAICKPFVDRHIQLINPKLIIMVGATAMGAIINNHEPISKIRGKFLDFAPDYLSQKIKLMAIFHPSYLMRQSSKKKIAWMDMLAIKDFMDKNL